MNWKSRKRILTWLSITVRLLRILAVFTTLQAKLCCWSEREKDNCSTSPVGFKKLIAIDQDAESLSKLKMKIAVTGLRDCVEVMASSFEDVMLYGDVVYFEFCLHEMANPQEALSQAATMAPDIVVFDHSAGSDWAFYAAEDEKVRRTSKAMERFGIRRRQDRCARRYRHSASTTVRRFYEHRHFAFQEGA